MRFLPCIVLLQWWRPKLVVLVNQRATCRFDTVFMDDNIRVAKDIRGDTLVVARDGPPRAF